MFKKIIIYCIFEKSEFFGGSFAYLHISIPYSFYPEVEGSFDSRSCIRISTVINISSRGVNSSIRWV